MLAFRIIVVSDHVYRGEKGDLSGERAKQILINNGYRVIGKVIVPNDPKMVIEAIRNSRDADALIVIGGTGPSPRDISVDIVESMAWRKIPGFGELFRLESYREIGGRGLISRSELYLLYDGRAVVILPGSAGAVDLGLKILLELVDHLISEARRIRGPHTHNHG